LTIVYIAIYTIDAEVAAMQTAKLFINGRSQAVRLPREFQFSGTEVLIHRVGDAVLLVPRDKPWEVFMHGLTSFSDDFLDAGRNQGVQKKRTSL